MIMNSEWTIELKEKIKNYDIITFDIFDTLIKRDCQSPENVFELIDEKKTFLREKFINERYNAEKKLYKQNLIPTLMEIYENTSLDSRQIEELVKLENEIETDVACANKPIYDIYLECIKAGKKVYAISDMYLSNRVLSNILIKCGYNIEKIWISAECKCNKASGKLFERFLSDVDCDPANVLHIGDSYKADIEGARKQGIASFLIPRKIDNLTYLKKGKYENYWEKRFLYPFINNHIEFCEARIEKIGYETLGPMVYGFCQWVHKMKEKHGINKLLFCARDVCQTMNIYNMLYPNEYDDVKYLYVSLKSLKTPYEAAIGTDTSKEALQQLKLIRKYLKDIGCYGKVAMVDSGCGGHTQHMLETILGDMCEFHGLYMRISKNFYKNVQDKESFPYMFAKKASAKSFIAGGFFESMLSATHGRTVKYEECNGAAIPVLGQNNPKGEIVELFQTGIEKFVKDWHANQLSNKLISSQAVEDAFLELAFFPLKDDVDLLADITSGNDIYQSIVLENRKKRFFKNLKDTYWKGGYLCKNIKSYKLICKIYLCIDELILNIKGF